MWHGERRSMIDYEMYEDEEEELDDEIVHLQKHKRMVNQKRSNR